MQSKVTKSVLLRRHKPLRYLYAFALPSFVRRLIITHFKLHFMKKKTTKFKQLEMFTEYKVIIQYKDCNNQIWQDEFKSLEKGVKEFQRLVGKEGKALGITNVKIAII